MCSLGRHATRKRLTMSTIDFRCSQCDKHFSLDSQHAGKTAKCRCGNRFRVPHQTESNDLSFAHPGSHSQVDHSIDEDFSNYSFDPPLEPATPNSTSEISRFCTGCGTPLRDCDQFCGSCGASLGTAAPAWGDLEAENRRLRPERRTPEVDVKWYQWWLLVMQTKYAQFDGRARRKEYWFFFIDQLLIVWGTVTALVIAETVISGGNGLAGNGMLILPGVFNLVFSLATLIPGLAVTIRRLHDIGKSGWWLLIAFVPLIGALVLLLFVVREGDRETNEYGPDPKR